MSFLNFVQTKLFANKKIEWEKLRNVGKKKLNAMNSTLHTEDIHVNRVGFLPEIGASERAEKERVNGHRIEKASEKIREIHSSEWMYSVRAMHEWESANTISRNVFADFHHRANERDIRVCTRDALAFFICTYHSFGLLMNHKNDEFIDRKVEIK